MSNLTFEILSYGGIAVAAVLAVTLFVYVYSKLSAQQRDQLEKLAGQAVSLAEKLDAPGEEKMSAAIDFVADKINKKFHTKFTSDEIKAALQFAFDHSPFYHTTGSKVTTTTTIPVAQTTVKADAK